MNGEFRGKTIEEALSTGLAELGGVKLDDVEVKIIKHPGIFSKAVVQMTLIGEVPDKLDTATPLSLMSKIEKRAKESEPAINQSAAKPFTRNTQPQRQQSSPVQQTHPEPKPMQNVAKPEQKPAPAPQYGRTEQKPAQVSAKPEQKYTRPEQKPAQIARPEQKYTKPEQEKPAAREKNYVKPTGEELEAARAAAEKYVSTAVKLMGIDAAYIVTAEGDEVNIDIKTDSQQVIGYRGETLDALEYLTMVSLNTDNRIKVNLDSAGYREKRTASLVELAKRLAEKAVRTGRKVDLEPMSSLNRKVIHAALSDNDDVFTKSEGHEPNRYLVIVPKKGGGNNNNGNGSRNNNRNRRNDKRGERNGKQAE